VAFETQAYPNTPNMPAFHPMPLRPGETYRHRMHVKFSALQPGQFDRFFG
jgi:galactose mutarotase-like enzyme